MDARSARRGYRSLIEDAGADALELNVYYLPTSVELSGREIENIYLDMLSQVKEAVTIPLAMKLSRFFNSIAHMSKRLVDEGASGLVFFNRFYQPDFDLERLEVAPRLVLVTRMSCGCPCVGWRFFTKGCSPISRLPAASILQKMF